MVDGAGASAIAELNSLPGSGGENLGALYKQVGNIKSQVATDAADRFRSAASDTGHRGNAVQQAVNAVEGKWQGDAADAFVAYMNRFTKAGKDVETSLNKAADTMDQVAQLLEDLKKSVDRALSNAAQEAKQVEQQAKADIAAAEQAGEKADPTPDQIRQAANDRLTSIKTEVSGKVEKLIEEAESVLAEKMGGMRVDLDGDGFCGIESPGGGGGTHASSVANVGPMGGDVSGGGGSVGPVGGGSGGGGGVSGGGGAVGGLGPSGGPPSTPVPGNVEQWIREAIKILQENGVPVTMENIDEIWTIIEHESSGNPHAINLWDCVPLDTMILTQRGWLKHDDVQVGDRTIGHNPDTGASQWTSITRVVHHGDAPLVRLYNSRWQATTTPNHRWLNMPRLTSRRHDLPVECPECGYEPVAHGQEKNAVAVHRRKRHGIIPPKQRSFYAAEAQFVCSEDVRSRDRLLLSAPAEMPGELDVSVTEAAVLGWIAGDGHVENRRHRPTMSIAQSKPELVDALKRLLADIPHAVYVDDCGGCDPRHQFRLDYDYAHDLIARAGNPKSDCLRQVLRMSTEQRTAWLDAITDAEGTRTMKPGYTRPQVAIYQSPGKVLDAVTLAVYLSGARPRVLHSVRSKPHPEWSPEASVHSNTPLVTGSFLHKESAGRADVWCVTTKLGTWTAREGEHVFLTGNSNAAAGHPSKGIMQCIDSTFQAHKLPGHGDIWDPVDNIIAGVRYTFDRYGGFANHPGLESMSSGGGYQGY